jgi:alkaline phosphatase
MKRKLIALLLLISLVLPSVLGCNLPFVPDGADDADTTVFDGSTASDPTTAEPEGTKEPEGTTVVETTTAIEEHEPEPEIKVVAALTAEEAARAVIVYPKDATAGLKSLAINLGYDIASAFSCAPPTPLSESYPFEESSFLIFVGSFESQSQTAAIKSLRPDDFVMYRDGDKLYICGGSDESTERAIEYFRANIKHGIPLSDSGPTYFYGDYPLGDDLLNGISLANYRVIIPKNATVYEKFAAEIFCAYIKELSGYVKQPLPDILSPAKYEILIGNTSRTESKAGLSFDAGEYALFSSGDKIVCLGDSYFLAAGAAEIISTLSAEGVSSMTVSSETVTRTFEYKEAKSAILLIGDGMGFNSIELARSLGAIDNFYAEDLAVHGQSKTNNSEGTTTDSAAGGTALSTGYKTKNSYVGMNPNGVSIQNLRELAYEHGAKTAVLTTDVITGATPAAFLAHNKSRNATSAIQSEIDMLTVHGKIEFCEGSVGDNLLAETRNALFTIDKGDSPFFIMIEEAYIDKNSHSNNGSKMSAAVKRFNEVIAYSMVFTVFNPDTVLVVTADHETGGITPNGNSYVYTTGNHTSANVPVYACGKGSEMFDGKAVENIEIAKFIAPIFGKTNFGQ